MREVILGTRSSKLALRQAGLVADALREASPGLRIRLAEIRTGGDNILDMALARIGDKGLFTKELEAALLSGEIDIAVHSMKDLPTRLPGGVTLGAICRREYPGDVLVSRSGKGLKELPEGAVVGTGSLRRMAQLKHYRNDLVVKSVRGNVTTRITRLFEKETDALVLAYAGLARLRMTSVITEVIPLGIMLPAAGQGAIGVETRDGDEEILDLVGAVDHKATRQAVAAERELLRNLEGGCQIPVGALGLVDDEDLVLEGMAASLDGRRMVRMSLAGPVDGAQDMGARLAGMMLAAGAGEILAEARREFEHHEW